MGNDGLLSSNAFFVSVVVVFQCSACNQSVNHVRHSSIHYNMYFHFLFRSLPMHFLLLPAAPYVLTIPFLFCTLPCYFFYFAVVVPSFRLAIQCPRNVFAFPLHICLCHELFIGAVFQCCEEKTPNAAIDTPHTHQSANSPLFIFVPRQPSASATASTPHNHHSGNFCPMCSTDVMPNTRITYIICVSLFKFSSTNQLTAYLAGFAGWLDGCMCARFN